MARIRFSKQAAVSKTQDGLEQESGFIGSVVSRGVSESLLYCGYSVMAANVVVHMVFMLENKSPFFWRLGLN